MRKISNKIIGLLLVAVFPFGLIGCGANSLSKEEESNTSTKKTNESFSIVDSYDRTIEFERVPKTIAVLNSDIYQLICLLGGKDKIIGISDTVKFPTPPKDAKVLGRWKDVNVEKILEVNPEVLFTYGKYTNEEVKKKLEAAGIKVVFIDSYKFDEITDEVTKVGKILGSEDIADDFNKFVKKYVDIINDRIGSISEEEKVNVYFEGHSDYKTVGEDSAGQELLNVSCVRNVAGSEEERCPKISDEWIIDKNPQVIIKVIGGSKGILGFGIKDSSKAKEAYNSIIKRSGWENLDAVKNKKVYILDDSTTLSSQGSIIGALRIAKICYPDKFKDIIVEDVHKELYSKFYGMDLEGIFVYDGDN